MAQTQVTVLKLVSCFGEDRNYICLAHGWHTVVIQPKYAE